MSTILYTHWELGGEGKHIKNNIMQGSTKENDQRELEKGGNRIYNRKMAVLKA